MKRYVISTFLLMLALYMHANTTFKANAPQVVTTNEPFRITYTINSQQDVKNFKPSILKGFNLLAGPHPSYLQSYSNINGKSTAISSVTYTLTLMATAVGEYTIPAASIEAEGKTIQSNPLKIKVIQSDPNKPNPRTSRGQGGNTTAPSAPTKVDDNELFILSQVTKTKVHEQEAFLLTYKIYSTVDIRGFNNVKLPDFKGFHSQEIPQPNSQTLQPENYKGRTYGTAVYRQFLLFPQKAGTLTIPSAQFDASVSVRASVDDIFEAMLRGAATRVLEKTIHTKELTIEVDPLPAGKPDGFYGGVGQFTITSSVSPDTPKTGDAISLKVTVSGTGNLRLITTPEVEFPTEFDVYDPKVTESIKPTSTGMTGKKVFEYLAIPRNVGSYTIPGIAFSYFDPKSKSYKTLTTQPIVLDVEKGKNSTATSVRDYTEKADVVTDIRYIKKGNPDASFRSGMKLWGATSFWLAYVLPVLLFLSFLIIYRKRAIENSNLARTREKKANKAAIRRLKTADKLLHRKEYDAFYDEVIRALWGYVSDKLTLPTAELTKENVAKKLEKKGVSEETTSVFICTLNDCEFAKYAPGDKNATMDQTYASAIDIITKLDNEIKR